MQAIIPRHPGASMSDDPENPYRPDTLLGVLTQLNLDMRRWERSQRKPEFGGPPLPEPTPQLEGQAEPAQQEDAAEPRPSPDEIDDDALVEQMEQMRQAKPRTVFSRWKAADSLAEVAKGKTSETRAESKRRRLHEKHQDKYPGDW
jgi:hypothetical protein